MNKELRIKPSLIIHNSSFRGKAAFTPSLNFRRFSQIVYSYDT
ncbi:MAG: hypothetical protein UX26_C0036G0005, partial [Parcubacteria group bacterium GW2011_GWC1_45_9]